MALSHFVRQSHFAITPCGGIINDEKGTIKIRKKDVLYATEPISNNVPTGHCPV